MSRQKSFGTLNNFDKVYIEEDFSDVRKIIQKHQKERGRFLDNLRSILDECPSKLPRVLEIGCGTAVDLYIVANRDKCQSYGIDLSGEALKVASSIGKSFKYKAHFVKGDAFRLPFSDNSFDLVFSQGVLEHLTDDRAAAKEQIRVLKPGGKLTISVPQKYTVYTLVKHARIRRGTWPWGYESEYSYRKLQSLGERLGLKEKSVMGYGYWLHPLEPMWFMRSLLSKFQKINPARRFQFFGKLSQKYDDIWSCLENRFGHRFLRDIAIVFEKLG